MAYGNELLLGFQFADWGKLGLSAQEAGDDLHEWYEAQPLVARSKEPLANAWSMSMAEAGFKFSRPDKHGFDVWDTPLGPRRFSPWHLELAFDPDEMEEEREHATIGVHITGRYFPTFADWQSTHGGVWPFAFTGDLQRCMDIARKHIVTAAPELAEAYWIVKELHY